MTMKKFALALAALTVTATPGHAHIASGAHGSLMSGLSHPFTGADHTLAMLTVGLWAALLGGNAVWRVPLAFVGAMAVGYGAALAGASLPFIEPTILASVVVLGLLTAIAVRVPTSAGMAIVAFFALFHGFAHAGEAGAAGLVDFAAGFAISTAVLHAIGAATGLGLMRLLGPVTGDKVGRVVGGAAAVGGIALAMAS